MNAATQYKLSAPDIEVVLALVRANTLAEAGERLAVDASTVFRSLQRIEKGLGQRLFERSRTGYQPLELAQVLASHGEQLEVQLESARSAAQASPEQVSGSVRLTTTDTVLHGLVAPALKLLQSTHPLLVYELHAGNELASLTRRDADIAVRATKRPPQHLVGKHVGPIRVALFAAKKGGPRGFDADVASKVDWIAPDDALPEHPSVVWRKKHFPKVSPRYRVSSILTVAEMVAQGMGIGLLPLFLAQGRADLVALTGALDECQTELWLLTHTESRHLRRVSTVFSHLAQHMALR
ncbi:LysR family transcriptional regulator [Polaromonas sp. JS666]|uniref:LysR family transcriptional regulator n=1 Tax=Polaromonas sp. (strain JS666 / ATCC BAA-500) TaxID=296591 RepID=UPI000046448F|nr:LysR family transcriptional regulator [Polaromonas sp. JS666]ABE46070.1 transcriptional regulator, LysR family [Polaromonas sp. JS666]